MNMESHLEEFIVSNRENLYRVAYSYVKSKEDALDIVQESIYKALRSSHKIKDPSTIKAWVYRILINTAIDFIRKNKKIIYVENKILDLHAEYVDNKTTDFDLQKALDTLPPKYKTIVILRFFEDMKIQDIGKILNINTNTVKTQLYAALKKLRTEMED